MRTAVIWLALLCCAVSIQPVAADDDPGVLKFTFVGNEAFLVNDGEITLATDYPYRSGSAGYMRYDFEETRPRGIVVCLVTHDHYDHWDFVIFRNHSWSLIGPQSVTYGKSNYDITTIEDDEPVSWESIDIEPRASLHADIQHYSYLVTWHGVRMYFPGDAEATEPILAAQDLDVAFVTPWLLENIRAQGAEIDAKRVVVYHHRRGQVVEPYQGSVLPEQGDTFEIPFREE
jgi:L-ascorbate metabolism protein UlaG (beta-lactamase superfamily)